MTILLPNSDAARNYGKRIEVQRGAKAWDAFDWLLVREFDSGHWYIPLVGYITPVVPLLLGIAKPSDEMATSLPAIVDLRDEPEQFIECVRRWIGEHQSVRERLRRDTGVRRWRKREDIDRAIRRAPMELVLPLKIWREDGWCWREAWDG